MLRITRRQMLAGMTTVALLASGCDIFAGNEDVLSTSTPTPTPTSTPTATTATKAGTATTTPTASATASARLRGALGVDHPPFAQNYGVGGNSVGLACVSGIPANGLVTITIAGGTGAPPTVSGPAGPDGSAIVPFPIQQFGPMNGSITGLQVNGQPAAFTADPFSYTVGSGDLICTPPR